jgi:hypothetical protein
MRETHAHEGAGRVQRRAPRSPPRIVFGISSVRRISRPAARETVPFGLLSSSPEKSRPGWRLAPAVTEKL